MKLKSKLFASAVAFTMVLSMVAVPVSAQTTAELTAQINALLAQIAQLQAQIGGTTTTAGTTFTTDLTLGSKGAEVTALQTWLVSKGHLVMPAGVAMGYFGPLTQAAVAKYQVSAGITPAAGYFGPITRAKVNAMGGTTTGGTTTTGGPTGITTPGVEGTLTVTTNSAGLVSTVYEGDDMQPIYGINVEAKTSDIAIQRVKVNLGENSKIYTKGYSKMYVTVDGSTLASVDLNSSTVVKESSTYYVTITGFNLVVPKGTKKQIVLKADVMSSIDTTDRSTLNAISLSVPANGVRGVDGAGIDQYGPSSALSGRTTTFSAQLSETATLNMSLNNSSPKKADVVATSGAGENELDKLTLLTFDVKAEKDDVTITDIAVAVAKSGTGGATASTTVYLFEGSTELDNTTIGGNTAIFTDFDYVVPKDTTKTLTVKADIRNANGTVSYFTASASTTGTSALVTENSDGDSVTESGSATGYAIGVRNAGPVVTLTSKSITTTGVQVGGTSPSTSTMTAKFNLKIVATGGAVTFGTVASGTPAFASSTSGFLVYVNGASASTFLGYGTSTSWTFPSACSTSGLNNSCTLSEGNSMDVEVSFLTQGRTTNSTAVASGLYSVGMEGVAYRDAAGTAYTLNFMSGESDWRTGEISFP